MGFVVGFDAGGRVKTGFDAVAPIIRRYGRGFVVDFDVHPLLLAIGPILGRSSPILARPSAPIRLGSGVALETTAELLANHRDSGLIGC
jgi:hypothetical protein